MTLHNALEAATPSQRLAAAEHLLRLARIEQNAKAQIQPAPKPETPDIPEVVVPETFGDWAQRQLAINPIPKEPWFSIEHEIGPPKISEIIRAVCKYFEVSKNDLLSPRRDMGVVRPRQIAYYLCKKLTRATLPEIGRRLGDRDHTSVLHGIRQIERLILGGDEKLTANVDALTIGLRA